MKRGPAGKETASILRKTWRPLLVGYCVCNPCLAGEPPQTTFAEHLIADHFRYAYGLAVGDLDGDGDLDLTAVDTTGEPGPVESDPKGYGKGTIYWFENDGKGHFQRHIIQHDEGGLPERQAIGDLNGDGHPDVVVVKNWDGLVVWFENSGHPAADSSWPRHVLTKDLPRAYDVTVADVDGDGRLDVVASAYRGDQMAWFANPGPGKTSEEWKKKIIDPRLRESRTCRVADFNGDGRPDVLATGFMENLTAWYERTAAPERPWKRHVIDDQSLQPTHGEAVDLDGDGDADVVMALGFRLVGGAKADLSQHHVAWYENVGKPGRGERWLKHVIDALAFAFETVAADVNGDGRIDVVAASYAPAQAQLIWYENSGEPQVGWKKHVLKGDWTYANSVIVADLNGDRRPDVLAESCTKGKGAPSGDVRWWENLRAPSKRP